MPKVGVLHNIFNKDGPIMNNSISFQGFQFWAVLYFTLAPLAHSKNSIELKGEKAYCYQQYKPPSNHAPPPKYAKFYKKARHIPADHTIKSNLLFPNTSSPIIATLRLPLFSSFLLVVIRD